MKRILLAALIPFVFAACSKVPAGNVGVKFNLYGGDKGVQTSELPPGRHWIGFNEELYVFPTFTQNYTWDRFDGDESLSFQTIEGLSVSADVGITYYIDPAKVTSVFQKYRKGIDEITGIYLRNMVRDALVKQASVVGIESVYGSGKTALIERVQADVQAQAGPVGIVVEKLSWVGELKLPANVVTSINAKIQATQFAEQRKNEIVQAEAEAAKVVAAAQGESTARLSLARAEAESIDIKGKAIARNPAVIQLSAIEKWDGKLPVYSGGNDPHSIINLK